MKTVSDLISYVRGLEGIDLRIAYVHPLIYIFLISEQFKEVDAEQRAEKLAVLSGLEKEELASLSSRATVQLVPLSHAEYERDYAYLADVSNGHHWLEWFGRAAASDATAEHSLEVESSGSKALHFYGLKGGQARSTVLLLLAKQLADSGLKVLVVDADIEAPSLDSVLDVAAESPAATLMGLAGWSNEFWPISRVYVGNSAQGQMDLLACRPKSESFDIDFASFLLSTTLDARVLQNAATKLRSFSVAANYDYVLIDHRTGLAPSVLPIIDGWPGPTVVFSRPDGMSRNLESAIGALLGRDPLVPGAFVTFSLDPQATAADVMKRDGKFVERLLEHMSDAISRGENDIDPTELERYWMLWCHDPSLLAQASPSPSDILSKNRETLLQLREVLGIQTQDKTSQVGVVLSKSGASDEGAFILTPDFARLFSIDSNIIYIFGRKGTGKTRLLKELHSRGLGFPLLVAQDYRGGGLQSGLAGFNALLKAYDGDYEAFWRALYRAGLRSYGRGQGRLDEEVNQVVALDMNERVAYADLASIESEVSGYDGERKVLLIDGVETAVSASRLRGFVEGLFRFMATVQFSRLLSSKSSVRLFIRSDLHKAASQNVEQQIEGRLLDLRWDRQSILNFAMARLASLNWFREVFTDVCGEIDEKLPEISRGAVNESSAEDVLLKVFPEGLDRNKVKTTTFLATYFSDAGGDSESRASFYPRLFDGFLKGINVRAPSMGVGTATPNGRLSSPLVLTCYDDASKDFLDEVRSELQNLLDFEDEQVNNQSAVNRFIDSFHGLRTPFVLDQIIKELAEKSELGQEKIRESMNRMKRLGIFEDRPGYPGSWRTGRLYKAGLNMKYVRAKGA